MIHILNFDIYILNEVSSTIYLFKVVRFLTFTIDNVDL